MKCEPDDIGSHAANWQHNSSKALFWELFQLLNRCHSIFTARFPSIDVTYPRAGYERSLFRGLLSESILSEDVFFMEGEQMPQEGVSFSYERLADHLIAKYLLDAHLVETDPAASFASGNPLNQFVKDEMTCWEHPNLIEAFSVQIPERINKELAEIATHCADFRPVQEAFINSLLWRRPNTTTRIRNVV